MDTNLAFVLTTVLVAIVGVVVPLATLLIKYHQDRRIADEAAVVAEKAAAAVVAVAEEVKESRVEVAKTATIVDEKLEQIYGRVDGRLTAAMTLLDEFRDLLRAVAPEDERVQAAVSKSPKEPPER